MKIKFLIAALVLLAFAGIGYAAYAHSDRLQVARLNGQVRQLLAEAQKCAVKAGVDVGDRCSHFLDEAELKQMELARAANREMGHSQ